MYLYYNIHKYHDFKQYTSNFLSILYTDYLLNTVFIRPYTVFIFVFAYGIYICIARNLLYKYTKTFSPSRLIMCNLQNLKYTYAA